MSRFRNAICHALGMQLKVWLVRKHPFHLQKVVYTYVSLSGSQRCSGASGLIVATTKWLWERERARAWHDNGREGREFKRSHNAVKSASRTMSTRESSST